MKLNQIAKNLALAGTSSSLPITAFAATPQQDTTPTTREANRALYSRLPFMDKTDFNNVHQGFIASPPPAMLKGAWGNIIWDPARYDFVKEGEKTPDIVDPSPQRQSQLLNIGDLFEVTDGVYQIRNLDLSNTTIIEGKTEITVIDPLLSAKPAKETLALYFAHRPKKPVVAVLFTHSHVDHYDGIHGAIDGADVKASKMEIHAPTGFVEEAVSESIMAGTAVNRRASYIYGNLLRLGVKGQVGTGLGTATSTGTVTLIPPTHYITRTGQQEMIDGLAYDLMIAPGSGAPSGMLWYVKKKKVIEVAKDVTHTLHNTYSLHGAKIRSPLAWSRYINATIDHWSNEVEVIIAQHHWPTWGNNSIVRLMKDQRDIYRYISDQTLRMASLGMTRDEIAANFKLPGSLEKQWSNRGYYGSVSHDVRATYVFYLGWFDGDPATLNELPPEQVTKKFVRYMGGADAIIQETKASYRQGNYRWMTQVTSKIVFADPDNRQTRNLEADALEQLGYRAEAGTWHNFYLTGIQELRNSVQKLLTPNTASPDTVRTMAPEIFSDYLEVHINDEKAGAAKAAFNIDLGKDGDKYKLELESGVLNHTTNAVANDTDASISLSRNTLNEIVLKQEALERAGAQGKVKISGNDAKLDEMLSCMDTFAFWFNIVTL